MIKDEITNILTQELKPSYLELQDDSAKHASHAGAKSGGGHFILLIVSEAFEQKSLMHRHKIIYSALKDLMKGKIHALSIKAYTPLEYQSKN